MADPVPCPFCLGHAVAIVEEGGTFAVNCHTSACHARGPFGASETEAWRKWSAQLHSAEVKRLEAEIESLPPSNAQAGEEAKP